METNICPNCGNQNIQNYCPNCGEEKYKRITLKDVIGDFVSNLFTLEGKVLKTVKDLSIRPGIMIANYLNGIRSVYYKPFQYYVLATTLYFIFFYLWGDGFLEMFSDMGAAHNNTVNAEQMESFKKQMAEFQKENMRLFTFMQVPIYAWLIWLFFRKKSKHSFTECLIVSLYIMAHALLIGIISTLLTPIDPSLTLIANTVFTFIYVPWTMAQLYKEKLLPTLLKSWLVIILSMITFGILMGIISVVWLIVINS